ncbi:MAG: glycosyltransferase family 4 protein [Betaproteobacteria bacterium]
MRARPVVLVLGPGRAAISGVSTHVNALLGSGLGAEFALEHFQVGSEGRREGALERCWRLAASPFALAAAIVRRRAALVHVNTSLNARAFWRDAAYLLVAKLCGARVLFQTHGGTLGEFAAGRVSGPLVRALLRLPDAVAVLATAEREIYRRLVPTQAVAIIPNGVDCRAYRRHARRRADPRLPLRLLYMGRLAPRKGLAETIEALRLARAAGGAARLVIAGSGPEEARLRRQAADAGLGQEVSFVGPASGEHKARLLGDADVLVLASESEGMPYALLEAMACGVVPLATPVGAIPEMIHPGAHGVLVPPRDAPALARAIAGLAADRDALERMGAACRRRAAAAYSLERLAADFSAAYRSIGVAWAPSRIG